MTACMLANNLGAQKTVARIDNYEYLLPKNKEFFPEAGRRFTHLPGNACRQRNRVLHPHELGTPMVGVLRRSLDTDRHQDARKSRDTGHPLHQLGGPELPYHVVAIKRGSETLIPRGDDTIKLHDIVYFTTTRKYVPYIRKIAGKEDYADVRNVMIMGGSRIAVRTAQYVPDYMQVKIVDNDRTAATARPSCLTTVP